jgi:type IV secretion system protein VirB10
VEISSPGGDRLGQGGLTGEVDSHFFARFGGAILLSVLNAGVAAVSRAPSTSIAIGSPAAAMDAAAGVTASGSGDIPPTITVNQGAPVTIFLARDLDFSNVKPLP